MRPYPAKSPLGNGGDSNQVPVVEALLDDGSALVRAMAVWALARLADPKAFAHTRERHLPNEGDPDVRGEWDGGGD